jgi:hypothetical protein
MTNEDNGRGIALHSVLKRTDLLTSRHYGKLSVPTPLRRNILHNGCEQLIRSAAWRVSDAVASLRPQPSSEQTTGPAYINYSATHVRCCGQTVSRAAWRRDRF